MKNNLLVLAGAIAGGIVGFFLTALIARFGMEAMAVPGGLVGLGAGISKGRSIAIACVCGGIGLGAGVFTEWKLFPFIADPSFGYFVAHLTNLNPLTLIMIAVGAFIAFWVPFRRR